MSDLSALNEDILLYLIGFTDLYCAISLSQTCRRLFEFSNYLATYWKYSLQSIKPAYLGRVKPWAEYTAAELRDAAIQSRNSSLIWINSRELVPKRWGKLHVPVFASTFMVPRTRWIIYTQHPKGTPVVLPVACGDLKTGKIAGSFDVHIPAGLSPWGTYCMDGTSISSNEIRLVFSLPGATYRKMLAVYQITFMEVSGPAEASDYRISAAVVFSIQQKFLNARLSLDGALLATCDERSLFLINVNTGDTLEWNNSTDHFTGDLCHVDEFTVVALSGHYRLVTICVPPIFRRSTRSPGSPSTSDVISDNEIHLILLPNLEMVGGLVGTMRRLWLLSPESGLGINKKITPYRRSIDVALTVNDTHIQFSKINLNLPSHSSTVLNPHSSEADNSSSQSAADSGDIMRTEFPVVNSSDPSMPVFTLRQPHQRTIAYRAYSSAADRYESWIHVIGVDRPGMSRQLSFPPECVNVEPWRIEEEAGVIISRGSVEGDEPFSFLWFV